MQYLKRLLMCTLIGTVLYCRAQPQLPSLIDDAQEQKDYLQNTVLKPGENAEDKIRSQIFIKTTVSKKSCFVGEPVLVVYQLYTALYCQPKVVKQPAFNGCSLVEMTTDEPEYMSKEDGKLYRVLLIRKVQLTPLQEGELQIPPATVSNEVGFTSTDDPYRMRNYTASVSSHADSIHVKALPPDEPADYSGIAGKFTIAAKVQSDTVPQNENDLLQVTISGEGNIDAVTTPLIVWPTGIEHFEGSDSQHINKMSFPVHGDKTFAIPFIGTQLGKKIIPSVQFTFFNTALQHFETITTKPIVINVTQAVPSGKIDEHIVTDDVSNKKYLWFVPGIAVIVISIWLISNKKKEALAKRNDNQELKKEPISNRDTNKQVVQAPAIPIKEAAPEKPDFKLLLQALSEAEDNYLFFTNSKTLLTAALQHALAATKQEEKSVVILLENKNAVLATEAKNIYAACNQYLYSPVIDDNARTALIERLNAMITQLENS